MRLTADIWVHVFIRREMNRGAYVTVRKKGASQAGAIFIVENSLDGNHHLYGPAPQSLLGDEEMDRRFEKIREQTTSDDIDLYLAKQMNFDPDLWIVEVECRQGPPTIEITG